MVIRFWCLVQTDRDRAFQCGTVVCRSEPMVPTLSTPTQTSSLANTTLVTDRGAATSPAGPALVYWLIFFFHETQWKSEPATFQKGAVSRLLQLVRLYLFHMFETMTCFSDYWQYLWQTTPATVFSFPLLACVHCRMLKLINHWILFLICRGHFKPRIS